MLHLQKFLRDRGGPDELKEIGVYYNRHEKYPNLIQFTYDQIECDKHHPIVKESRGIILDESNNWAVVAYPFNRFFNYGEAGADEIDWTTAKVQEKVDGSLIIMYHYNYAWHVATRGSASAAGSVGDWKRHGTDEPWTFRDLFWHSAEYWMKGLSKTGMLNPFMTYIFELTSPFNRVVCDYTKIGPLGWCIDGNGNKIWIDEPDDKTGYAHDGSRITLIGVRYIRESEDYPELSLKMFLGDFHYVVKEFPLTSFDEVVAAANALDPMEQEGFVVVDANFNRVKIKSPKYVAIHHIRDGFGPKRIVELIKLGEEGEFLTYYPEFKDQFEIYKTRFDRLIYDMDDAWYCVNTRVGFDATQKEFALEAVKTPVPAFLFTKRKSEVVVNALDFLRQMPTDKLMDLLDKRG